MKSISGSGKCHNNCHASKDLPRNLELHLYQNLKVHYRQTMVRKMLQYLDKNKPIKAVDLKDAVFIMAKAWDNVSQTTIKNCWKKAGFPGEVLEPTQDPFESDEEDEGTSEERGRLWGRVLQEYPLQADVPFAHFASLDSDIITECQTTEEDATRQALEAVQSKQTTASDEGDESGGESDSDGSSISVIEPTPLTPLDAKR